MLGVVSERGSTDGALPKGGTQRVNMPKAQSADGNGDPALPLVVVSFMY